MNQISTTNIAQLARNEHLYPFGNKIIVNVTQYFV